MIIKTNIRVAESVGPGYFNYLQVIFQDLLKIYKFYSDCISQSVVQPGNIPDYIVKPMRSARRDTLRLIQTYLEKEVNFTLFGQSMLPPLQQLVDDYKSALPQARDPEVLMLFSTLFKKTGEQLTGFLHHVVFSLCESTLDMIKNDTSTYPEFRHSFFMLIKNIIKHCT